MYRIVIASLCLVTAAPAFAGEQASRTHTAIVGSFTNPINYRPHNAKGNTKSFVRGYVSETELVRTSSYNDANTKYLPRTRTGAGSLVSQGPVTEVFVENLPALNGTRRSRQVVLGSNLPRN